MTKEQEKAIIELRKLRDVNKKKCKYKEEV